MSQSIIIMLLGAFATKVLQTGIIASTSHLTCNTIVFHFRSQKRCSTVCLQSRSEATTGWQWDQALNWRHRSIQIRQFAESCHHPSLRPVNSAVQSTRPSTNTEYLFSGYLRYHCARLLHVHVSSSACVARGRCIGIRIALLNQQLKQVVFLQISSACGQLPCMQVGLSLIHI